MKASLLKFWFANIWSIYINIQRTNVTSKPTDLYLILHSHCLCMMYICIVLSFSALCIEEQICIACILVLQLMVIINKIERLNGSSICFQKLNLKANYHYIWIIKLEMDSN